MLHNHKSIFPVFVFILLAASHSLFGQSVLIVKDLQTGRPLAGASVQNLINHKVMVAGANGKVKLQSTDSGNKFRISFVGYKTVDITVEQGDNYVYLEPDYQVLNAVTVTGYASKSRLSEIAGAYAITPKASFDRFNEDSPVRAMNMSPGIRLEERSPGSYRVSIRGNLLRAPYGVRNVKVYWNDIPYTDPNGSTPLNLLDVSDIGRVETIRGPAGSVYGAGIGGVLNIYSNPVLVKPVSAGLGFSAGSFGYYKTTLGVSSGGEKYRFSTRYNRQISSGYRDHTNLDRETILLGGSFHVSGKRKLSALMSYSDLFYQLPGGLTREQYDENPRQARPGAAEQNSSIDHQYFMAGLVQDYRWNDRVSNTTSVFLTNGVKENPFITNYELERLKSYGGRTVFNISTRPGRLPTVFNTGAEVNFGNYHAGNYGNRDGYADTLRYEDQLNTIEAFIFLQAAMELSEKWKLTAGASLNYLNYNIHRLKDVALDTAYRVDRTFRPEFIPRIGITGSLTEQISVHGSVSTGFSPPTIEEIRTSDGGINSDLQAERAVNYELGMRGNAFGDKLYYDLTAFWMRQKETIVSKTNASGSVVFENTGSTNQGGVELLLGYNFIKDPHKAITLLRIQTAYTYHNFKFRDYVKRKGSENVDYSGNALTGTSPNIVVTAFDFESHRGFSFHFTHNFTDRIPLNDANTVYSDRYNLITITAGCKKILWKKHRLYLFVGVDNLLNEKYSLGNDLNAYGGRYFNPAPERNYFGGIKMHFNKI